MTNEQANNFIQSLFTVWQNGDVDKVADFYAQDLTLIGFGCDEPLGFENVKNRMQYVANNHKNRHFDLYDVIVSDNKIVVRLRYNAEDLQGNEVGNNAIVIYELNEENKVINM